MMYLKKFQKFRLVKLLLLGVICFTIIPSTMAQQSGNQRSRKAAANVMPRLKTELASLNQDGLKVGNPVFIRIFKETREMEVWIENSKTNKYVLFKTYKVAAMSGKLGPKLKEGDRQAPEGFYFVNRSRMNPSSRFHLAFNVGYPNTYDRARGRTGSALMVHGNRVSIGCFAMTDRYIEEIYTLCDLALTNGQPIFRVHSFPFRMTPERMAKAKGNQWYSFWQNLQTGYDYFEKKKVPPNTTVANRKYVFK